MQRNKNNIYLTLLFIVVFFGLFPKNGNSQKSNLKPVTTAYAITNAIIVQTPNKTISKGTVLIENGIIQAVGTNITIPAHYWKIAADSMYVYAGFISGLSTIGIAKPKIEKMKDDRKLTGNPSYVRAGITPEKTARSMVKTNEKSIEKYRKLGFTATQTVPHDGMIAGKAAFVLLGGDTPEEMIYKDETALYCQFSGAGGVYPNTVIGVMAKYRDLYKKSVQLKDYTYYYTNDAMGKQRPKSDQVLESLFPIVSREMPVLFKTNGIKDVLRAITLQKELGFSLMLGNVEQGWDAISEIKHAGIPVFLSLKLPAEEKEKKNKTSSDDSQMTDSLNKKKPEKAALLKRQKEIRKKYYSQAQLFIQAGIPFGFSTLNMKPKNFKKNLNLMLKNGITESNLLASLTTQPAKIFGVSNVLGTIETGKIANMVITDKPFFNEKSKVKTVFVDGVRYEYKNEKKDSTAKGNAIGKWKYTAEIEALSVQANGVISFADSKDNYTGTITVDINRSTNELSDITFEKNKITFSFIFIDEDNEETSVTASLNVDNDTFEGTFTTEALGTFPVEGSKVDDPD